MTAAAVRALCDAERERLRGLLATLRGEYVDAPEGSPFERALIDAVVSAETLIEDLGTVRDNIGRRTPAR